MGVLSWLKFWEKRSNRIDDPHFWVNDLNFGLTKSGTSISADSAMRISTVYACTSLLSAVLASLPLQLFKWRKSGGQDPAEDHYLYPMFHYLPNGEQTSYEFREMLQGHLCLRGNGYVYKEMGGDGRVKNAIPLNPARMNVTRENGDIWYNYSVNNDQDILGGKLPKIYRFPADVIWHIKGISTDGLMGLSPITMARESMGLAKAAEEFGAEYFGNKPIPGGVASHQKVLSEPARERLEKALQRFSTEKRHKVMVLEEGMTWQQVGLSNEDSQFLETRSFQVEDVCRFFNVPPYLVHHQRDKASTFASAEQLSLNFVVFSFMAPWVTRWEQSLAKSFLTERERSKYFFKFNLNALQRGDYKSRMEGYAKGRQWGIFSANDCRSLEDMNPREGGDQYIDNPQNITGKIQPTNNQSKQGGANNGSNSGPQQ